MLSCSYTSANFKLTKYQHLELILRENKLTYTKLISNATHFETKIGIELNKRKKKIIFTKKRETLFRAMSAAPVCGTGGKPSTWFPPGELVEQSFFLSFVLLFSFFFVSLLFPIIFLFWVLLSSLSALLPFHFHSSACLRYAQSCLLFIFSLNCNFFLKILILAFDFRCWSANKL